MGTTHTRRRRSHHAPGRTRAAAATARSNSEAISNAINSPSAAQRPRIRRSDRCSCHASRSAAPLVLRDTGAGDAELLRRLVRQCRARPPAPLDVAHDKSGRRELRELTLCRLHPNTTTLAQDPRGQPGMRLHHWSVASPPSLSLPRKVWPRKPGSPEGAPAPREGGVRGGAPSGRGLGRSPSARAANDWGRRVGHPVRRPSSTREEESLPARAPAPALLLLMRGSLRAGCPSSAGQTDAQLPARLTRNLPRSSVEVMAEGVVEGRGQGLEEREELADGHAL